jgi:hypothetical protein
MNVSKTLRLILNNFNMDTFDHKLVNTGKTMSVIGRSLVSIGTIHGAIRMYNPNYFQKTRMIPGVFIFATGITFDIIGVNILGEHQRREYHREYQRGEW